MRCDEGVVMVLVDQVFKKIIAKLPGIGLKVTLPLRCFDREGFQAVLFGQFECVCLLLFTLASAAIVDQCNIERNFIILQ